MKKEYLNQLFIDSFEGIEKASNKVGKTPFEWACSTIEQAIKLSIMGIDPIDSLSICDVIMFRFHRPLKDAGYDTMGDLAFSSRDKVMKIKGIGSRAISDIEEEFKSLGLWWK